MDVAVEDIKYTEVGECSKRIVENEEQEKSSIKESVKDGLEKAGNVVLKGWTSLKEGVHKANEKFKESKVGKKAAEGMQRIKDSEFTQKVKEGAIATGHYVKEGAIVTSHYVKEGAKKTGKAIQKGAKATKAKINKLTKQRKHRSNEETLIEVADLSDV